MIKRSVLSVPQIAVETNHSELVTHSKMAYAAKLFNEASVFESKGVLLPSFLRPTVYRTMYMHLKVCIVKTEFRCMAHLLNEVMYSQNNYN